MQTRFISIWLIITLLFFSSVSAQNPSPRNSKMSYPYIQYNISKLENFPINKNLDAFFNKLNNLSSSRNNGISILHIGGSHIQAGVWPLEMKNLLETLCPESEGSMGLVFPFGLANTHHPYYYSSNTKGQWATCKITDSNPQRKIGLAGIMAYTSDHTAEIEIVFNKRAEIEKHKFDKVSVFHNIEDDSYDINVFSPEILKEVKKNYETGAIEFYFKEPQTSVKIILNKKNHGEFRFYGMYLENSLGGINYTGIGINGAGTKSYQKAVLFTQHLKAVKPDLVILSIGVNDAAESGFSQEIYEKNYETILESVLEVNPKCAFIFTTNNDFYNYGGKLNPNQERVYESMCNLGKDYRASVWNLYNIMGGQTSINLWQNDELAKKDRIHFTVEGYKIVANLFFDAINKEYIKYLDEISKIYSEK